MDEQMIRQWWDVFKNNSDLTEIRILDGKKTYSGYYKNIENILRDIRSHEKNNIYFILNRIDEGCYGRTQNEHLEIYPKATTNDNDIVGRDFILIDIDPKRKADTNSTDEELERAHLKAVEIYKFLMQNGFYEPIICMSGNGYHLLIRVAMKASDENTELVKRFLNALGMIFTDEYCDIDLKVFNNSRICKLYGTKSNKGADIKDRPKRCSKIIKVPQTISINDNEYIKKIAELYPQEIIPSKENNYSAEKFDLDAFISKHNIEVSKIENVNDGKKYILDHCLFDSNHKGKDAVIFQRDNGAISYFCFHSSCSNHNWKEVRQMFEPNAYEKKYENRTNVKPKYNRDHKDEFIPQDINEKKGDVWIKLGDVQKAKMDENDFIITGITEFDRLGLGLKRKYLTVLSGLRSSGKSSLINMMMLNQAQHKYNIGLWSGEMDSSDIKQWLYLQAAGKQYVNKRGESEYYETKEYIDKKISIWLDKYLSIYNNKYSNDVLQLINEIKNRHLKECFDIIYIDNLMVLGDDSLDGTIIDRNKKTLILLHNLAEELNIHIVLIAHPNKNNGLLRLGMISGTADISNLAQNVFLWHRVKYNEDEYIHDFERDYDDFFGNGAFQRIKQYSNILEIAKFRSKGSLMGKVFGMYYEKETGRFKNYISEHINYNWEDQPIQQAIDYDNSIPFEPPTDENAPF